MKNGKKITTEIERMGILGRRSLWDALRDKDVLREMGITEKDAEEFKEGWNYSIDFAGKCENGR